MKIDDNILMDFVDGLLDEEDEKKVHQAIEEDSKLKDKVIALKKGMLIGKMSYNYEVENAPDPRVRLVSRSESSEVNQKRPWLVFPFFSLRAIPAMAACLLVAFIGGTQLEYLVDLGDKDSKGIYFEKIGKFVKPLSIPSEVTKRSPSTLELSEQWWKRGNEQWWISGSISLSISSKIDENKVEYIPYGGNVVDGQEIVIKVGSNIESKFKLEVFEKSSTGSEEFIKTNERKGNLTPGEAIMLAGTIKGKDGLQKLVITTTDSERNTETAEFIYNIISE